LSGEVECYYQRDDTDDTVHKLHGVKGVLNDIKIKSRPQASDIKSRIENTLKRSAELEANAITALVTNDRVTPDGKVKAWHERDLAERTAWPAPGVVHVDDRIHIF
jgi:osmotically-inducible protein OsmY